MSTSRLRRIRDTLRVWLQPPRRLRFTRAGVLFTAGVIALGFATLNTGNNLLYLLLGALLGLIVLSGWLSEQAIGGLRIARRTQHGVAGEPVTLMYEVHNGKSRLPTLALELIEADAPISAFVAMVPARKSSMARVTVTFPRRGVYRLHHLTLSTTFPFGLFIKERDVVLPGAVIVWPRTDRPVRAVRKPGTRARHVGIAGSNNLVGGRGEYRSLRPYQAGDDPRDVHWRTTARLAQPLVREYERDNADAWWLALDLRTDDEEAAEVGIELAASIAARALNNGERVGLITNDTVIDPGNGGPQLERMLDVLARARVRADAPALDSPVPHFECVLVGTRATAGEWSDVVLAGAT